jgi:hypothetical protein
MSAERLKDLNLRPVRMQILCLPALSFFWILPSFWSILAFVAWVALLLALARVISKLVGWSSFEAWNADYGNNTSTFVAVGFLTIILWIAAGVVRDRVTEMMH